MMPVDESIVQVQRQIYGYILENPGTHLRELARKMNINLSTLRYHVDYLEKIELLVSKKDLNLKTYYAVGKVGLQDQNTVRLLHQKRFRDIIILLITNPGIIHGDIIQKLGLKPSTLSKYLKILSEHEIIDAKKIGNVKQYYVRDISKVMELLLTYKKSFWDSYVDNALAIYYER